MFLNKRIYLDYASLTPVDPRVIREMKIFSASKFANPSSLYKQGVWAKNALASSRNTVAKFIHAHLDEIVFTGGGTESNNIALQGSFRATKSHAIEKPHLIISAIEHSSIIEVANYLEKEGCEVTRLHVDKNGMISLDELKNSIKPNTFMVSIMSINNEIGTIEPIREIAKTIRVAKKKFGMTQYPLFHTDASQAPLYLDLNVEKLGVDLLTLDGTKTYGPRGIGALYVRRDTNIEPILFGGGQEALVRSGTENIPAIAGFAKSLEIAEMEMEKENLRIRELKNQMIAGLKKIRNDIFVNGDNGEFSSPHILSVTIPGIDNEFLVLQLDAKGIACSTKSSCLRDEDESYVLRAIGSDSKSTIRFSFGRWTKKGDIRRTLKMVAIKAIL